MNKKEIKVCVETDFNSKHIHDFLKSKLSKKFSNKIICRNFENININLNSRSINNDFIFIISHLDRTFTEYSNFNSKSDLNLKKIK